MLSFFQLKKDSHIKSESTVDSAGGRRGFVPAVDSVVERIEPVSTADRADWIHLEGATEEEMQEIAEHYGLPIDYLTSTLDPDEVSRSENLYQESVAKPVLILLHYPVPDEENTDSGYFTTRTIAIILTADKLITCMNSNPDFLEDIMANRFDLVYSLEDIHGIVIEIAWRISESFVHASKTVRSKVDELQDALRKSTKTEHLLRLADLDKSIIYLKTALDENRPILEGMSDALYLVHQDQEKAWLHDVLVENHQADRMASQTNKMLEQLDSTFSSIIQNNLNVIMKVLTSLTIIITIPTIISGYWGMNVHLPFVDNPLAFLFTIVLTVLLMAVAIILLKRKDLL